MDLICNQKEPEVPGGTLRTGSLWNREPAPMLVCWLSLFLVALLPGAVSASGPQIQDLIGRQITAHDTLAIGEEPNEDARACLQGLIWPASEFTVEVIPPVAEDRGEALIRFPSPRSPRDDEAAHVYLEWYPARNEAGAVRTAPAVVVVHESGRGMTVGRMVARGFAQRGIHAFMIQLPGYGARRWKQKQVDAARLKSIPQGVGDVRRARDAVAVLPCVQKGNVSLQGTSLGGFISSTAAGLDHGYQNVFLLLSGGDVYSVLQNGDRDAAKLKQNALEAGLDDAALKSLVWQIEPNRLAHRVDPARTWLYSGVFDTIVPIENGRSFAKAARLPESHHVLMPVDHFAGFLLLPAVMDKMTAQIQGLKEPMPMGSVPMVETQSPR